MPPAPRSPVSFFRPSLGAPVVDPVTQPSDNVQPAPHTPCAGCKNAANPKGCCGRKKQGQ